MGTGSPYYLSPSGPAFQVVRSICNVKCNYGAEMAVLKVGRFAWGMSQNTPQVWSVGSSRNATQRDDLPLRRLSANKTRIEKNRPRVFANRCGYAVDSFGEFAVTSDRCR